MSRYETLRTELGKLKTRRARAVITPTAVMAVLLGQAADTGGTRLLMGLATLILLPLILHRVWRLTFPAYRAWADRSSQISAEIADLQRRVATLFDKYCERRKGEHFKKAYALIGRAEDTSMKCGVCGAQLRPVYSALPFKVSEQTIVILKDLPVWQCENCAQYLLENGVLSRVDAILARIDRAAELEIIRYAA